MDTSKQVQEIISKAKETKSTKLDLSNQSLTKIPEEVFELTNLTELNLNKNHLTSLPEAITKLSQLTILKFGDSKRMFWGGNQLKNIPDFIVNLSNLLWLDLSYNSLNYLPDCITKLSKLNRLSLRNNQLTNIPDSICNLSELAELDLRDNQLENVPESIAHISSLTRLDLRGTKVEKVPESIINISNLPKQCPVNNPPETLPIEIAGRGNIAMKQYVRQLEEEGEDYLYEAKLLIVGEAGAGKTSLAKKINNLNYQLQSKEKSTEGIDVIQWSFDLENKRKFDVNIWDFGGQEVYHATHQFFLTKRSLYVLVVDNRKEDDNLEYWLNIVELLSDHSPLIIIKNEKQDRVREIPEKTLRGQFDNLKETMATNLETKRGLNKILKVIKYHISNLDHIGSALPKTWVKVRQALESDPRNYISIQEYFAICEKNGFTKVKDKLQLSSYLHDLGVCLHFQDDKHSLLYETIILKPEWGTYAVYKVLDNQEVINNQGCFNSNDLDNIWSDDKYTGMQGRLLALMIKFQLCYKIPQCQDTFIAPQLLSVEQPNYNWNYINNLIIRYKYPDFMPKGIITRFIVVMHKWIDLECEISKKQYVWRSGVVLKKDETRAEIIEYYSKREITIHVTGKLKRDLMTQVTYELDNINKSFNRLNYEKLIPCNCETCINSQNPHGYDYELLLNKLDSQKYTIDCEQKPFHTVQIPSLIDHSFINNSLEGEKATLKEKEDPITQMNIKGDHNQIIIKSDNQENVTNDSFHNKHETTLEEGNYTESIGGDYSQQTENNSQISTDNQSSENPEQNDQFPQKKFDKNLILGLVTTICLIFIVILANGILNNYIEPWLDSIFSNPTPELQQEDKENN